MSAAGVDALSAFAFTCPMDCAADSTEPLCGETDLTLLSLGLLLLLRDAGSTERARGLTVTPFPGDPFGFGGQSKLLLGLSVLMFALRICSMHYISTARENACDGRRTCAVRPFTPCPDSNRSSLAITLTSKLDMSVICAVFSRSCASRVDTRRVSCSTDEMDAISFHRTNGSEPK